MSFEESKGMTIGQTLKGIITGNASYSTPEQAAARMEICKVCPRMQSVMKVCKECGCYLPAKVKFTMSVCPIGKW